MTFVQESRIREIEQKLARIIGERMNESAEILRLMRRIVTLEKESERQADALLKILKAQNGDV
jgi:hypothetical protein